MLVVCALGDRGQVLFREAVGCRREVLEAFARAKLQKTDRVAAEATTNAWAVAATRWPFVATVTVGKPDVVKNKVTDCRRKAGKAPNRTKDESDGSRLNDLYRGHGLPACQPPAAWPAGERRATPTRR